MAHAKFPTVTKSKPNQDRFERWLIFSDPHSHLLDKRAYAVMLAIYGDNAFDRCMILGDLVDASSISTHKQRFSENSEDVNWLEEIDFTCDNILSPLAEIDRKLSRTKSAGERKKICLFGNHCDRAINVHMDNHNALKEIVKAGMKRNTLRFHELLRFAEFGIEPFYSGEDGDGIYMLRRRGQRLAMLHGTRTSANRLKQNLDMFQCHVITGHTHKLERARKAYYGGYYEAMETGCMRTIKNVEFLPTGHIAGWAHGFVTVWVDKDTGQMFLKQHEISNYRCEYKGVVYSA